MLLIFNCIIVSKKLSRGCVTEVNCLLFIDLKLTLFELLKSSQSIIILKSMTVFCRFLRGLSDNNVFVMSLSKIAKLFSFYLLLLNCSYYLILGGVT